MKLNFDIVFDALSALYPMERQGSTPKELTILAPRFYTGAWAPDYLYLVDGVLPPADCTAPLICDRQLAAQLPPAAAAMILQEPCAPQQLMNALLTVFNSFDAWDQSLQAVVEHHHDLRVLVERGAQKINCRLLVSNKKLLLLADSKYPRTGVSDPLDYQGQTLPNDVVRIIERDLAHRQPSGEGYLAGHDGRYEGKMVYNKDLFIGNRYEGTCSMMESQRPFQPSDFALFEHFFQYAHKLFLFYNGTRGKSHALRTIIMELLAGRRLTAYLKAETAQYAADFSHYRCIVISAIRDMDLPGDYLIHLIESTFAGSISLLYNDDITAFLPDFDHAQCEKLLQQLDKLELVLGSSAFGSRITDCRGLYIQAVSTLEIGREIHPDARCYFFEDYMLHYLLRNSSGTLPPSLLQTAGMQQLTEYNAASSVDYLETLRVYLDCEMSVTEASRKLYLHRSSFLKRLERLQALLGEELTTPEGRFLLRWQLYRNTVR